MDERTGNTRQIWGFIFFIMTILGGWGCVDALPNPEGVENPAALQPPPAGYRDPGKVPLFEASRRVERENWQKPQLVVSRLGDIHDKTIVDIGAGTGYFTLRLAEKADKVIATDIDQRFLDFISSSLNENKRQGTLRVETRLTQPSDPGIKPAEADIVFIVNTYHLISDRIEYFRKVHSGLRDGGTIFIVDFKKRELPVGPPVEEKIPVDAVFEELFQAGFDSLKADTSTLDFQYIITGH